MIPVARCHLCSLSSSALNKTIACNRFQFRTVFCDGFLRDRDRVKRRCTVIRRYHAALISSHQQYEFPERLPAPNGNERSDMLCVWEILERRLGDSGQRGLVLRMRFAHRRRQLRYLFESAASNATHSDFRYQKEQGSRERCEERCCGEKDRKIKEAASEDKDQTTQTVPKPAAPSQPPPQQQPPSPAGPRRYHLDKNIFYLRTAEFKKKKDTKNASDMMKRMPSVPNRRF